MNEGSGPGGSGDSDYTDLRALARRFLAFERGFLRRQWAAYYAIWACAVTGYFLVPFLLSFTSFAALSATAHYLIFAGVDVVLTIAALIVSVLIWGHAERTFDVRSAVDGRPSLTSYRNLLRIAIILALVVGIVTVSTRSDLASYLLGDALLLVLSLFLLLHLRRAFRPIPVEGWLAVTAFVGAIAFSYGSLLLFDYPLGHEIAWFAAVVVWLGCAAYSRFGVPDEAEGS